MIYRTRPVYSGDDWHELRDAMNDEPFRAEVLADIAGHVSSLFLRAAICVAALEDPTAIRLRASRYFDARAVLIGYGHLAAFWRLTNGCSDPRLPGLTDLKEMTSEFHKWVRGEVPLWFLDNPLLIRRWALLLAHWDSDRIIEYELDLKDLLDEYYPLLPPESEDMVRIMARRDHLRR